jgi:putative membrane protein
MVVVTPKVTTGILDLGWKAEGMTSEMYGQGGRPAHRWVPFAILALAVLFIAALGLWFFASNVSPPVYTNGMPFFWWFPFGWFFFIPVFFIFFFAFRWFFWGGWGWWGRGWYYRGYYDDPALATLRERYARGEITKEQYEQMRRDLEASG